MRHTQKQSCELSFRKAVKVLLLGIGGTWFAMATMAAAAPATSLQWNGAEVSGINEVKLRADGRVQILHTRGGFSAAVEQLPAAFLKSWGLNTNTITERLVTLQQETQGGIEGAVRNGMFREVDGVVYDLRQYQPEWTSFRQARLIRILPDGMIFDVSPEPDTTTLIVVANLPVPRGLPDRMDIHAKLVRTYDYPDAIGNTRKLRLYDAGRRCARGEIPESITMANQPWAPLVDAQVGSGVLAKLPDGHNLKGNGTGFFISEDGYLLTNAHVVEDATRVSVKCKQGIFPARVVLRDASQDLALLKLKGRFRPLTFAAGNSVALGTTAFTIGFPNVQLQGLEPKFTDGKISALSGLRDDPTRYQISVPVQPGNSGGPLLDQTGRIIGVVDARLNDLRALRTSGSLPQNVNYAIKGSVALEFAKRWPSVQLPGVRNNMNMEEAVKLAEEATAMVLVY